MKIAFTTLGCKLNYAETSTYERGFKAAGWEVVPWTKQADVYLINTCAVTETAEKKSRNLIRRAHKTAPEARIVVTGCYAELRKEQLLEIEGVWRVFGATEKSQIRGLADAETAETPVFGAYSTGERTRSFLKVQDGCDNFCAYCTVPYARGRSRNLSICECVKMARNIAAEGVKEVVLTGVNTGDFGRTTGETFLDLLKALRDHDLPRPHPGTRTRPGERPQLLRHVHRRPRRRGRPAFLGPHGRPAGRREHPPGLPPPGTELRPQGPRRIHPGLGAGRGPEHRPPRPRRAFHRHGRAHGHPQRDDFSKGPKFVSFAHILRYNTYPLTPIVSKLLEICCQEMQCSVELEFAADLTTGIFNALQIRPISADSLGP